MFSQAKLQTIICTSMLDQAESFYRDVLELPIKARSDGALVFDVGGGDLRVSPVPSVTPSEHTVLGFSVADIDAAVQFLRARGVEFVRFDGFPQDNKGVLLTPDKSHVAWFRDPDGNLLSVVQFPVNDKGIG